ncbi:MAG: hypothetical protein Q8P02_01175, partial [Candidatus Micrarchaeota archaeon]|nr:hypothetical protein [Candidatus Micrarchaeota archaeon]
VGPLGGLFFQDVARLKCHGQTLMSVSGNGKRRSIAPTAANKPGSECAVDKKPATQIEFVQQTMGSAVIMPGVRYAFCLEPDEKGLGDCETTLEAKPTLAADRALAAIDFLFSGGQFVRASLDSALAQASPSVKPQPNAVRVAVEQVISGFIQNIFGKDTQVA